MSLNHLLSLPIGWLPLADAAVKASLLIAAAGLIALALRRASAASRHLVWTSALLASLALPVVSLAVPRWQVGLVTFSQPSSTVLPWEALPVSRTAPPLNLRYGSSPLQAIEQQTVGPVASFPWASALLAIWAAGALLILARIAAGIVAVRMMARRTEDAADATWLPLARELAAVLGVPRVAFRRSSHPAITMPMAWGIVRPAVALPAAADVWPQERLRIVLLHELAHVKRADCLTHLLAQGACAVYWMNPLAWMAARRARSERERACDDLVLAAGTPGPDYADLLLEIARGLRAGRFSSTLATASLAMAHRSQLEGRLMAILDPSLPRTGVSRVRTAAASVLALAIIVPLGSIQPWTHAQAPTRAAENSAAPSPNSVGVPGQFSPARTGESRDRVIQVIEQSVADETVHAVTKETVRAALEGGAESMTQSVLQGVLQSIPNTVTATVEALFQGNPNPNPNPNPSPVSRERQQDGRKADPKVVAALTDAMKDTDKEVREAAMHALVRMRDPAVYEPLVQALKDASPDVREQAAHGLGQLRDRRAVAPLSAALKDASEDVREQAAFALGQMGDPAAIEGLIGVLKDKHANVREQAAFALGQLRATTAVEPLLAALKDASVSVREQAAFALGQIGDPRAADGLTMALKDESSQVRQQAAFALGQLAR